MATERKADMSRVKRVLIERTGPGKDWSRRGLSIASGMGADAVRDILSGRSGNPTIETLSAIAGALKEDVSVFLSDPPSPSTESQVLVEVIGNVAAGVWRESMEWPPADRFWIGVLPSPVPEAERFALVVEGYSMDRVFQPGTVIDCIRVFQGPVKPRDGDLVVVERTRSDLREVTCKRLVRAADGRFELRPESTRPEFQEPLFIGAPDRDSATDEEVQIVGIVVGSYSTHFRRR